MSGAAQVFSPIDIALGLTDGLYSQGLAQQMVWLSGLLPYAQCSAVLERIGQYPIRNSSVWQYVQKYGEALVLEGQHEAQQVSPERLVLASSSADHQHIKGVSMDGGMVNIRGEGWKEIKVGAIYDVSLRLERDARTGEYAEFAHAQDLSYTAVLGDVQQFSPALWALAVEQQVPTARQSSVTADGAEWIWNLSADLFPDSSQIVDWFHATDHLSEAAHALFPDQPKRAETWFHQCQDDLFLGNIPAITDPLDAAGLSDHSHYFHTHQRRMQYQEFREQGLPIGSGSVESTVKQFKARLAGPGMRWKRPNAQRMLLIRAAVLDNSFDTRWKAVA